MSAVAAERKTAQDISIEYVASMPPVVIEQSTVKLIWGIAEDAQRDDLEYDRRREIIDLAVAKVDKRRGNSDLLKQVALFAILVYDLPPKALSGFIPRLMPSWRSEYTKICVYQANKRHNRHL